MSSVDEDPLAVARAAFDALDARDWRALLGYVDPAALPAVKQHAISVAEMIGSRRPPTPDDVQQRHPGLPPAVAEWFAEEERRALAAEEPAGLNSLGAASIEELRSLPDGEVFVRWLDATSLEERVRRLIAQQPGVTPEELRIPAEQPVTPRQLIGFVKEDGIAHVLYRADEGVWQPMQVESLRWTDRGWRLSVDGVVAHSLRTYIRVSRAPE